VYLNKPSQVLLEKKEYFSTWHLQLKVSFLTILVVKMQPKIVELTLSVTNKLIKNTAFSSGS
jgi:hypothetical protein